MTQHLLLPAVILLCSIFIPSQTLWAANAKETAWEADNLMVREALDRGDTAAAVRSAESGLKVAQEAFGEDHMKTAVALRTLADVQRLSGHPELAATTLARAGRSWAGSLGNTHPYVTELGVQAARDLAAAGDPDAAVATLTSAIEGQKKYFGERHTAVASSLLELARIEREAGRDREALAREREAVGILLEALEPAHPRTLEASAQLANRLSAQGDLRSARQELKRVLDRASASALPPLKALAEVQMLSGDLAFQDRDVVAAEAAYAAAETLYERAGGTVTPSERLTLLYKQRELFQSWGREDAAIRAAEAARGIEEAEKARLAVESS